MEVRAAPADLLPDMPWNRWKGLEKEVLKEAHQGLQEWKEKGFENELFRQYYKEQGVVPAAEWPAFHAVLAKPLRVTFRVNPRHRAAPALLRRLGSREFALPASRDHPLRRWRWRGAPLEFFLRRIGHLPPGLEAWELGLDRAGLLTGNKKHPAIRDLQAAMSGAIASGCLARQEVVSMLPVAVLDVGPGQRVLDVCASPGSKTAQLLEAVCAPGGGQAAGLVVANDAGLDERMPSLLRTLGARPAAERMRLVVTSALGERLPRLAGLRGFDRVLVDAPCSGDGTIRKAPDVLRRWSPEAAHKLHGVQVELAVRGLQLLREGGSMVYSTCSLNPIEDEAVVAEVLRRAKADGLRVELADIPAARLGGMSCRPGLEIWKVCDVAAKGLRWIADPTAIPQGMAPPTESERLWMRLDRCRRVLPQDQDTGGFFLSSFQRRKPDGPPAAPAAEPDRWRPMPKAVIAAMRQVLQEGQDLQKGWSRWLRWDSQDGASGDVVLAPADQDAILRSGWPLITMGAKVCSVAPEHGCRDWVPDAVDVLWALARGAGPEDAEGEPIPEAPGGPARKPRKRPRGESPRVEAPVGSARNKRSR